MPYARDGATKVPDHWIRSPLLNVNRACQACHKQSEDEIKARVDTIQTWHHQLLQRGGAAIVAAKNDGATPEQLAPALELRRKAQWRPDFIAAENSMGFRCRGKARAPWPRRSTSRGRVNWSRRGCASRRPGWPQPRRRA